MKFIATELDGATLVEMEPHRDERGYFARTMCVEEFGQAGLVTGFPQASQSHNLRAGTIRGMHFQDPPHAETKLVRCVRGAVWDVIIDLRPGSPSYRRWQGFELSAANGRALFIPEGFAHGFVVLSDVAEFCYKCTDVYDPTAEGGIPYDDPTVNVQWPDCGCEHKTSAKDKEHTPFAAQKFEYFEKY